MTSRFDITDVPAVTLAEMWLVMRLAIGAGRGLVLYSGAGAEDVRHIETVFWKAYRGDAARGTAILVRFWCLADAFACRRLRDRFLHEGHGGLAPALAAAATLRLNASWGFPPQRLIWAMARYRATSKTIHARDSYVVETPALAA